MGCGVGLVGKKDAGKWEENAGVGGNTFFFEAPSNHIGADVVSCRGVSEIERVWSGERKRFTMSPLPTE